MAVHLAVTNLAVWWSEGGKIVHTRGLVFQRQVEIGLDLAGFDAGVLGLEVHRRERNKTLVLTGDL
jgi:hypothetical protein